MGQPSYMCTLIDNFKNSTASIELFFDSCLSDQYLDLTAYSLRLLSYIKLETLSYYFTDVNNDYISSNKLCETIFSHLFPVEISSVMGELLSIEYSTSSIHHIIVYYTTSNCYCILAVQTI